MADPTEPLTFHAWQRDQLFDRAERQGPRLGGTLALTLTDTATGQQASEDTHFTLMSASDVGALRPGAVKHLAPAPFVRDAETTKLVHVDLWESDLPWRYTPRVSSATLPPWLVLLVGTVEELSVDGGTVTHVSDSVLATHDLATSHLWAHTQWDGHTRVGRIVSPRGLERDPTGVPLGLQAQHEYLAVLVPAFNEAGEPMWTAPADRQFGSRGVLPAFLSWRFWTAETGDFETLAAALRVPPAHDVGKARLHYRRTSGGSHVDATLEVRGAITSLQQEETTQPDELDAVVADLRLLHTEQPDTVGLPQYGRPWLPEPESSPAGWGRDLNDDPRLRGTTGLGTCMGVEAQEALMDAAVAQAGALREAGQRIGQLAMGLAAAGSLWDRRLPTDRLERLQALGPVMARLPATGGGSVLDRVTSGTSPLTPAQFSSAAHRILRDRTPSTRHLSDGAGARWRAALDWANTPEPEAERAPDGLPHLDLIAGELGLPGTEDLFELDDRWLDEVTGKLDDLVAQYRHTYDALLREGGEDPAALRHEVADPFFEDLMGVLQEVLADRGLPCDAQGIAEELGSDLGVALRLYCEPVLADEGARRRLHDGLRRAIRHCMGRRVCADLLGQQPDGALSCDDLLDSLPTRTPPTRRPVDLGLLSDILVDALDPRRPRPPAHVRLCERLVGVDCSTLVPPELPIGLDFPTWGLLKQYDVEWLLPGVHALEKDSVTALQTNPTFVDAFMTGINTAFISEMRWRDLAVSRTCTPLRMFWGQVDYTTHTREADIEPLAEWAKAPTEPVGALSHQTIKPHDPANTSGSRLVLTIRSDLFRRYPTTVVYLVGPRAGDDVDALLRATPELDMPSSVAEADVEQWRAQRRYYGPVFAGALAPDLTFFTFDVTPSDLDLYWLVLDEPPAELRFRNDRPLVKTEPDDVPLDRTNAATLAGSTLDQPTRVAISGAALEQQALAP